MNTKNKTINADCLDTATWIYLASLYGEINIASVTEELPNVLYAELSSFNLRVVCSNIEELVSDRVWAFTLESYPIA